MSFAFYSVMTRSGARQARLPLVVEGDFGTTISTFSTATFSLDTNDVQCPADWADHLEPHRMSIVIVEEDTDGAYSEPIWMGMINDTPIAHGTGVKITTASLEWYLANRRVRDVKFGLESDLMTIPKTLVQQVEANGIGIGLDTDCPLSGIKRAMTLKHSDGESVSQVLEKLGIEWTVALSWSGASQASIVKTFTARGTNLGAISAHPETVFIMPGNMLTWAFTSPMTEGKTATYIVAEGDGTGDLRTTSAPEIDTAREQAGYPRIEHYQNFQGVTNVLDANVLADNLSQGMFTRRHVITLTGRNSGAAQFRNVKIGSSVRLIIDAPELQLDEVWRFVGWTMDGTGQFWTPTLAKLGTKAKDFPRAPSPSDLGRQVRDLAKKVDLVTTRDPLINGYTFPANSAGISHSISPEMGFGSYDSTGTFTPGFGGAGSGSGSGSGGLGTIADPWGTAGQANIVLDGETLPTPDPLRYLAAYQPVSGDKVAVGSFNGESIILGRIADVVPTFTPAYWHAVVDQRYIYGEGAPAIYTNEGYDWYNREDASWNWIAGPEDGSSPNLTFDNGGITLNDYFDESSVRDWGQYRFEGQVTWAGGGDALGGLGDPAYPGFRSIWADIDAQDYAGQAYVAPGSPANTAEAFDVSESDPSGELVQYFNQIIDIPKHGFDRYVRLKVHSNWRKFGGIYTDPAKTFFKVTRIGV